MFAKNIIFCPQNISWGRGEVKFLEGLKLPDVYSKDVDFENFLKDKKSGFFLLLMTTVLGTSCISYIHIALWNCRSPLNISIVDSWNTNGEIYKLQKKSQQKMSYFYTKTVENSHNRNYWLYGFEKQIDY